MHSWRSVGIGLVLMDASTQVRENISTVDLPTVVRKSWHLNITIFVLYMDSMFLEGKLTQFFCRTQRFTMELWMRNGIATTPSDNRELRLSRLIKV